jgi:hypothetical protein
LTTSILIYERVFDLKTIARGQAPFALTNMVNPHLNSAKDHVNLGLILCLLLLYCMIADAEDFDSTHLAVAAILSAQQFFLARQRQFRKFPRVGYSSTLRIATSEHEMDVDISDLANLEEQ